VAKPSEVGSLSRAVPSIRAGRRYISKFRGEESEDDAVPDETRRSGGRIHPGRGGRNRRKVANR